MKPEEVSVIGSSMMKAGLLELPFYIASVLYIVSILLFWLFFRNARAPEEIERLP